MWGNKHKSASLTHLITEEPDLANSNDEFDMFENDQFPPKWSFSSRVAKGRQGSPMVAKGFQGPRGTPGMGEMSYNQIDHI